MTSSFIRGAAKAIAKNGKSAAKAVVKNGSNGNGLINGLNGLPKYLIKEDAATAGGKKALQSSVDQHLNLKFNKSPVGRRGQALNMKAFGLHERELDPLITNKELDMKWDETMGAGTRELGGEEYKYQPAGTKLTKPSNISPGGQRPLMTKKKSTMDAGKKNVNENRKPHDLFMREQHPEWIEDYTAKNARAKMLNSQEIERRIAQGERIPAKAQYVMFEHDIAIRAPLWDKLGIKGANNPTNTFVSQNLNARNFKDFVESNFYQRMKSRGNNWYLKTDRSNMRDLEVWEVSTGKLLGIIKMPRGYTQAMGMPQKVIKQYTELLNRSATGYKS